MNALTNSTHLSAPISGVYDISGSTHFSSAAQGHRQIGIYLNGTSNRFVSVLVPVGATAEHAYPEASTLRFLNAGDYVELKLAQSSTTPSLGAGGGPASSFQMTWDGPGT